MENKKNIPSHSSDNKREHKKASFSRSKKLTKEQLKIQKAKIEFEKEKRKLEELIEKRIEEAEKQEEKQKQKSLKHEKNNKLMTNTDTSVIPTITLKDFVNEKKKKEEKESFFKRWKKKREEKKKLKEIERAKKEELKRAKELEKKEQRRLQEENKNKQKASNEEKNIANEEKRKLKEIEKAKKEELKRAKELEKKEQRRLQEENKNKQKASNEEKNIANEEKRKLKEIEKAKKEELKRAKKLEKEERKRRKEEEKKKHKEEMLQKKKELEEKKRLEREEKVRIENQVKEEKEAEKRRKLLEKERLKEEKQLLDSKTDVVSIGGSIKGNAEVNEKKLKRAEEKRIAREKKEAEKQRKEEERKAKLKAKFEEEQKRKKEKEEKAILLITERREKENRIKKEKEQARKERKEKALLIKKAQEESKAKEKKERKTLEEKLKDWYNNLSFVKDRQNRRELQRQTLLIDFDSADAVRSEEKIMYKYVAKNGETGKVEKGMFAAFSKLDVHSFLLAEGYEVYEITPQKNLNKPVSIPFLTPRTKFKASELDFFLTQLSTFLKSGITLVEAVKILEKQTKKQTQRNTYKSIIYELSMGENFSEALSKQGNIFPRLLINMIKTSELTGDLPETLDDMADYYRETEKTRKAMISALTYPAVVLTFAVVILIFIMVSVIPQFVSIYNDMEAGLPKITVAVINLSNFLQANWIYVVLGIIAFIILFIVLFKSIKVFKSVVQSLVMNIPIMGKIIIYNEVTMFTKTFASLLNHNVYITDCMEVLSKITNNEVYKMMIFDTITNLARGEAISNSFKNHWAFPTIAYEMILTGEKTGQLGTMMDKVATYYQEQHKNAVNQIKAFIEPVMIIALAAIIGVVLLSVVIPMFDMYQNIGL